MFQVSGKIKNTEIMPIIEHIPKFVHNLCINYSWLYTSNLLSGKALSVTLMSSFLI